MRCTGMNVRHLECFLRTSTLVCNAIPGILFAGKQPVSDPCVEGVEVSVARLDEFDNREPPPILKAVH